MAAPLDKEMLAAYPRAERYLTDNGTDSHPVYSPPVVGYGEGRAAPGADTAETIARRVADLGAEIEARIRPAR